MNTPEQELAQAIANDDADRVRVACNTGFEFGDYKRGGPATWIGTAAQRGSAAVIAAMLDAGFNINALRLPEKSTALDTAIGFDHDEVVELLLQRGADPNLSRPMISALNERKTPERRLKYIKLLVEHGADVNRLYDFYGDNNNQFTALDWTKDQAVAQYLRKHGAKTSAELATEKTPASQGTVGLKGSRPTPSDEVIRYCENNFGVVDKISFVEVVPTGHPISIHSVRPKGDRQPLTLFTTGLSDKLMKVPNGEEAFGLAELFIQLPGDWFSGPTIPLEKAWILRWIRKIAQYPHDNNTWLGGRITIVDNEDPPQPLSPDIKFTSWLLLAEKYFKRGDGKMVQLYRMIPIFIDESIFARRKGAAELIRAFDRGSVPFILDLERKSVVS